MISVNLASEKISCMALTRTSAGTDKSLTNWEKTVLFFAAATRTDNSFSTVSNEFAFEAAMNSADA